MSGDYSRHTFDPKRDFSGVLMQQGRVQLDADGNEQVEILDRRWRAETTDIIGRCVVPKETRDGFKIQISGGTLTIGRGRMYVHGLLAENHGKRPLEFDPVLAEERGTLPVPYAEQPYLPSPPDLAVGGPHLVYIDVWKRELTYLEKPELIEKAVGVDTTARLQTVWQVKLLLNVGAVTCDDQIRAWLDLTQPSAGRMTTGTTPVEIDPDPCLTPPTGGYKGLENQLYRAEIHNGGPLGTATFKWSRDNATVAASVTAIPTLDQLIVTSTGRDSVLRFTAGDWVEITDDVRELAGLSGEIRKVKSVDDPTRTITLESELPADAFPTDAQGKTNPARHTRLNRWDQKGKVRDSNGDQIFDLDSGGSAGVIPVPAAGTSVILEDGVTVAFHTSSAGGIFRVGDYWVFAARTADASVELLDKAPPLGIHHHYCRLALVTFPDTVTDCRHLWPPAIPAGGDSCACTVCVTPENHKSGALTIQNAIDQVIAAGGGTVCLEVGDYALPEPVKIQNTNSVTSSVKLVGKGIASRLVAEGTGAVLVNESHDIVLDSFSVQCSRSNDTLQEAVDIVDSYRIRVEHLAIQVGENPKSAAIGLAGVLVDLSLRENALVAATGIRSGSTPSGGGEVNLADVRIEDNDFDCAVWAIAFAPVTVHQLVNRICGNRVNGCKEAGLSLTGMTAPGYGLEVQANVFSVLGDGIVASLSGLRVLDNDILQTKQRTPKPCRGISLEPGPSNLKTDCQIVGNRIQGFIGAGIVVTAPLRTAMIKQNQIALVKDGLVLESRGIVDQLSIENNQFNEITGSAILAQGEAARYAATGNQIRQIRALGPDSSVSAVIMDFRNGDGVFSHNECYREGNVDAPDVVLMTNTLIVDNNRVDGGDTSLELHIEKHYTVLGNICRGKISVLPDGLSTTWVPLNLQSVG